MLIYSRFVFVHQSQSVFYYPYTTDTPTIQECTFHLEQTCMWSDILDHVFLHRRSYCISFVCCLIFITTSFVILSKCSISRSLRCSRPSSMECFAIEETSWCKLSRAKTVPFNIDSRLFPRIGQITNTSCLPMFQSLTTMQRSPLMGVLHCA